MTLRRPVAATAALLFAVATGSARSGQATVAADLCPPAADPCVIDATRVVDPGSVLDFGPRTVRVTGRGSLRAESGTVEVRAGALVVDRGGSVQVRGTSRRAGGTLAVRVSGDLRVDGSLDVSGAPGGSLIVEAGGQVAASGTVRADAQAADANGGGVSLGGEVLFLDGLVSATGGGRDGIGGSVRLAATGDAVVNGRIDVSGADGGRLSFEGGGSLVLGDGSRLDASADRDGGFGGDVTLDLSAGAGGLRLEGEILVFGLSGGEETGGGDGGSLTVRLTGELVAGEAARIRAGGGAPDGSGGTVDIDSTSGSVVVPEIDVSATGIDSGGGSVEVLAGGDLVLARSIVARGGGFDADAVLLASRRGEVRLESGALVDVSGRMGGSGGEITIEAGTFDGAASAAVLVAGNLLSAGGQEADDFVGDGGDIEITCRGDLTVSGVVASRGGFPGGSSGDVALAAGGRAVVTGEIAATGNGRGGFGGSVSISAAELLLSGPLDAAGTAGVAGEVAVAVARSVEITGRIDVAGDQAGDGGEVSITSGGHVAIAGPVVADAGPGGTRGGGIEVEACSVDVGPEGLLSALGTGGFNRLRAPGLIVVEGTMLAGDRNELVWRDEPPVVTGRTEPRAIQIPDPGLPRCAPDASPTPAPTPTPTPAARCAGDCNGDGRVTINELVVAVNVALDRSGPEQCPAADGDGDGQVRIAELVRAVANALGGCPA